MTQNPVDRLTAADLLYLRLERPGQPCHVGGLAVVEGIAGLPDEAGVLELLRAELDRRTVGVRRLRQRVAPVGPLGTHWAWVDDERFDIRRHVWSVRVPAPGGEPELLATAAQVFQSGLDRRHPLWEMWLLRGLAEGRVGVLIKLHHALGDGSAAMEILRGLLDQPQAGGPESPAEPARSEPARTEPARTEPARTEPARTEPARTEPAPTEQRDRGGRTSRVRAALGRGWRGDADGSGGGRASLSPGTAPALGLNQAVRSGRVVRSICLDLAQVRSAARGEQATVNDLVLALWCGGLGRLLDSRGSLTPDVEVVTSMPVSLRLPDDPGGLGNRTGVVLVRLPAGQRDPRAQLRIISERSRAAREGQRPAGNLAVFAALLATPIGRWYPAHQRSINVVATNLRGPQQEFRLLGGRVLRMLPILDLVGNVGLVLGALSYAGHLELTVTADAGAFPDVDEVLAGMADSWRALREPQG